jgi:transcriptional regulator with XRE-family HTH domain
MAIQTKTTQKVSKAPTKKALQKPALKAAPVTAASTEATDLAQKKTALTKRASEAAQRRQDLSKVELSRQIGARLKQLRIAHELSQEQLGGDAELVRTAIGAIETGANPTIYTLSAICRALNVTLSEFLSPITLDTNIKPTWLDPEAVKRRSNRASPERKDSATARGLR